MIWERWRERQGQRGAGFPTERFGDLLEEAPVMALLLDRENRVLAANLAARSFFGIDPQRLPLGLLDATREGRLLEVLRAGRAENEFRLSHRRRTLQTRLVPGPRAGDTLVFLTDVTEQRRLETVRQEFVANLSHELKTPLTSLRLAAESLAAEPPAAARRRFAERVVQDADHLAAIVDNLRRLAEIETGTPAVEAGPFDVAGLVAEVAARQRLEPAPRTAVAPGLCVTADRAKLAQALAALLENAARFSPRDVAVEVAAEVQDGELLITVRDHGPGISPEHWPRVFERFYKVDPARSRAGESGSGLGLAIAKHLVLAQGGRIWTEAAPGGGQLFLIAVPDLHNRPLTRP